MTVESLWLGLTSLVLWMTVWDILLEIWMIKKKCKKENKQKTLQDIICKNILVLKKSIPNYIIVEVAGRITHFHSLSFIYHVLHTLSSQGQILYTKWTYRVVLTESLKIDG